MIAEGILGAALIVAAIAALILLPPIIQRVPLLSRNPIDMLTGVGLIVMCCGGAALIAFAGG